MRFLLLLVLLLLTSGITFAVDKIVVVGLFKDTAILKIDGQQQLLKAGETSPEGVKLIEANSQEAVIEINGVRKTYELGTHISGEYSQPASGPVLRLWPDPGSGLYIANGSINGFSMKFVVDTGATLVSMNRLQARRLGINYRLEGRESVSQTASGVSKIYIVELDEVRVGDIELKNVKAAVHDSEHPQQVLLGNSFLGRIDLRRDGRVLELQGNP